MFEAGVNQKLQADIFAESREQLAGMEADLLAIEADGAEIDGERLERVHGILHFIKTEAGSLECAKIGRLALGMEKVLARIGSRKIVPGPDSIHVLLRATDCLSELLETPETSNDADISDILSELTGTYEDQRKPVWQSSAETGKARRDGALRVLLVEDDFASRLLLQTFLSRYGDCHIAVNGREAVDAFRSGMDLFDGYDLICMDIMMPEMDGREAVRQVRALEEARGIRSSSGAKIIMTTTVDEIKEVALCFKELCDAYLTKPINLGQLLTHMKAFQLVP